MKVTVVKDEPELLHLKITGEIRLEEFSVESDPLFMHMGPHSYQRHVIVDLSEVEVIDSYGVNWLLSAHRRLAHDNGKLVLFNLSAIVRRVINILRLNLVFAIAETYEEAVQLCKGEAG